MEGRPAAWQSVLSIRWLLCALLTIPPSAAVLHGQGSRSPQDLLREAQSLHQAGKLDQAIEDYRLILKDYPDVAQVRSNLGAALASAGRYEEAIVEYERALTLSALPQIRLNLALAYYKTNQIALAMESLKRVHADMPNDTRVVMLLADCHLRMDENAKVVELLDPLEASHKDDLAFAYLLGTALVRDGQVERGQVLIDRILKNGDSAEARLLIGMTKLLAHDAPGAVEDLQKAAELNPNLISVHAYYGRALRETANPEGAKKEFRAELSINPNDFYSNLHLGVILKEEQQFDEALRYLKHALEIRPGDPGVLYQIAALHLAARNYSDAQKELEAIVKDSPNFREAHVALATLYYRLRRKEDGDREQAIVEKMTAEQQARDAAEQLRKKDQTQPPTKAPD
jgi:tetratricopeptide (TPR) repeat protein